MKDDPKERWLDLCALAAKEQDANKLIALMTEIVPSQAAEPIPRTLLPETLPCMI